jgi:hypothetical protein
MALENAGARTWPTLAFVRRTIRTRGIARTSSTR